MLALSSGPAQLLSLAMHKSGESESLVSFSCEHDTIDKCQKIQNEEVKFHMLLKFNAWCV